MLFLFSLILNISPNLTELDYKYIFTILKLSYNIKTNMIDIANANYYSPYDSNLINIQTLNVPFNETDNVIAVINNYISQIQSKYTLSIPEQTILNAATLNINLTIFRDVLNIIFNFIQQYNTTTNPFNINTHPYSYNNYNYITDTLAYPLLNSFIFDISIYTDLIQNLTNNKYYFSLYNGFTQQSDIINYLINMIIYNKEEYAFLYNTIDFNLNTYINNIINYLLNNKYEYLQKILNISIKTDITKIIDINTTHINFQKNISYIDYLYLKPESFINITDILYHGSTFDLLLRNMILQNPVKHCWVPELGYYIIDDLTFNFDKLLIDEYDSNLLSLIKKMHIPYNQYRGLNKLIGNDDTLTTYDKYSKGDITLYIPLNFYFCKDAAVSMPMINLLYTQGIINFTLKSLDNLLLYDNNAIFIKKPKLKCSMLVQYIYLEEDERKKTASSKLEFLIEKYKFAGVFNYNYKHIVNNALTIKLRITDPTKYLLWSMRVNYKDKNENNFKWNNNEYYYNNKIIQTTDYIKIYFNGSVREQGYPELFNIINPHMRYLGNIDSNEFVYSFALYPLIYQPSGHANLSQLEDVIIEHKLNKIFIDLMILNNLTVTFKFWGYGNNIIRMISGMAAPIFYE